MLNMQAVSLTDYCPSKGGHGTGKTGNLMLNFPDKKNTGNLVNLLHRENFENLDFFGKFCY